MLKTRGIELGERAGGSGPGEAARDLSRLAELYVRYWPAAVRLGYLLTGDSSAGEDLAQEAFVRLAGRFHHLRRPESFEAYLRRTISNLHLSQLRRLRLERAFLAKERATVRSQVASQEDSDEALWQALQQLPARQRAAIVLRYYEDLSEQATAESLRCSVAAVKSLVARGMAALRRVMEEER